MGQCDARVQKLQCMTEREHVGLPGRMQAFRSAHTRLADTRAGEDVEIRFERKTRSHITHVLVIVQSPRLTSCLECRVYIARARARRPSRLAPGVRATTTRLKVCQ